MSVKLRDFPKPREAFGASRQEAASGRLRGWQTMRSANFVHACINVAQLMKIAKFCVRLIKIAGSKAKNREIVAVNSSFHRPSAQIFQFASSARGLQDRRKLAQQASNAQNLGKSGPITVTGAWYHDAAIKDDDRGRKG